MIQSTCINVMVGLGSKLDQYTFMELEYTTVRNGGPFESVAEWTIAFVQFWL